MFSNTPSDLYSTLVEMERRSRERSRFNQVEARETMKSWMGQDSRFKDFDAERVIDKLQEARNCGGVFVIDDPGLKRGGQSRPQYVSSRNRWSAS